MPTVLRIGPYRFGFFSADRLEPQHVHVVRDRKLAKFWLEPIELASNRGFSAVEINRIRRMIMGHLATLLEKWNETFGNH